MYSHPSSPWATTYIQRNISFIFHDLSNLYSDCILLELLPRRTGQAGYFVLNIYSHPRDGLRSVFDAIDRAMKIASSAPIVITGDFNAPHVDWGYAKNTRKGISLSRYIQQNGCTLVNDCTLATRIGNSVSRNTTPDLTFTRNVRQANWMHTGVNLGSDHYILTITLPCATLRPQFHLKPIVDWDKFRKIRDQNTATEIRDYKEWASKLQRDIALREKMAPAEHIRDLIDSRLLHLWEAYQSLEK